MAALESHRGMLIPPDRFFTYDSDVLSSCTMLFPCRAWFSFYLCNLI